MTDPEKLQALRELCEAHPTMFDDWGEKVVLVNDVLYILDDEALDVPYRYPPVDPATGAVSAAPVWDREGPPPCGEVIFADNPSGYAILMGQMRHCDVPAPHRKDGCVAVMDDHAWIDNHIDNGDGTHGTTVCPETPQP